MKLGVKMVAIILTALAALIILATPIAASAQADPNGSSNPTASQNTPKECPLVKPTFFFFPPWWEYLKGITVNYPVQDQCIPNFNFPQDVAAVGLAVLDMLLRLAGFVAVIAIIISGAQYIFSGGNAERAVSARWRIYNALIGLAIVSVATAAVTFIGKQLS